jgi:hypothetical protein
MTTGLKRTKWLSDIAQSSIATVIIAFKAKFKLLIS